MDASYQSAMFQAQQPAVPTRPNGLVDPAKALAQFKAIESELYRFPAIDPASFRQAVDDLFRA